MTADPFGTGRLRAAALDAWAASPTRFREDANAEEDHAHGGYRDRVVVELAQNAADAADGPGRLHLALVDDPAGPLLVAANTGVPLDADGVASLASLRASAKHGRHDAVGRFGVGFAAVRSVADDVALLSTSGAVHFSSARTADAVADVPGPAAEVAHRAGVLPALRLPFPGPGDLTVPDGVRPGDPAGHGDVWATSVVLRLRDDAAVAAVREQLAAVGDALLLALPALATVVVDVGGERRVLADVADRWVVARRSGDVPGDVLADRPVEERTRATWSVTWAAPRPGTDLGPRVVHAPTPTAEPSTVPALLVATFPLDPSRRHVPEGALTDLVVAHAGRAWRDLVAACRDDDRAPDPLDLVPDGLPGGLLDAAVRDAVVTAMRDVPFVPPVGGGPPVAPADATVLAAPAGDDERLLAALGGRVATLVRAAPRHRAALRTLGAEQVELADVVDALPDLTPAEHRDLLDAVPTVPGALLDAVATVPVPLADGRTVRGVRGAVVLGADVPDDVVPTLAAWGLRVVHPDAAHPHHERLGAQVLDVDALLRHPVLRDRVLDDEDDVVPVLLRLLSRASPATHGRPEPWWGELVLPAADGDLVPARGLVLPGSAAAGWFVPDVLPPLADDVARAWPADVLAAAGVRTGLPVVRLEDADGEDVVTDALDGWADHVADGGGGPQVVVADLDAVRPERWPDVLTALVTHAPEALRAGPGGRPSYVTWWLRERSGTGVGRPFALTPDDAVLPPPPAVVRDLGTAALRLLGGVDDAAALDLRGWLLVLRDLPDGAPVPVPAAAALWSALARAAGTATTPALADELARAALPAWDGARAVVSHDVVVGSPRWAQHAGVGPVVVVPADAAEDVADLLDADLAAERAPGRVTSHGRRRGVPDAVLRAWPDLPATWVEHAALEVDGGALRPLPGTGAWWVDEAGDVHATGPAGLARGLAAAVSGWSRRHAVEAVLADPDHAATVAVEGAGDA